MGSDSIEPGPGTHTIAEPHLHRFRSGDARLHSSRTPLTVDLPMGHARSGAVPSGSPPDWWPLSRRSPQDAGSEAQKWVVETRRNEFVYPPRYKTEPPSTTSTPRMYPRKHPSVDGNIPDRRRKVQRARTVAPRLADRLRGAESIGPRVHPRVAVSLRGFRKPAHAIHHQRGDVRSTAERFLTGRARASRQWGNRLGDVAGGRLQ